MSKFTDNPELKFHDISKESWRTYEYPDETEVTIRKPVAVCFSDKHRDYGGNGHRLVDSEGISHYIPAGWIHLSWRAKKGEKPYQF